LYENGTKGVAYGLPPVNENAASNLAAIGPGLYKSSGAPQIVFSAAESYFLQAEATERGWLPGGSAEAEQLVEAGKLASFEYLEVADPAGSLDDYNSGNDGWPDVDYSAGTAPGAPAGYPTGGLFTILSQKWFALNGINTLEVWTDYRRVPYTEVSSVIGAPNDHFVYGHGAGYTAGPRISVSPQLPNPSTAKIPVRYLYPQTEYNYNAENVGLQGTINQFTSRIFWDLN
jgi:hypothetical protein